MRSQTPTNSEGPGSFWSALASGLIDWAWAWIDPWGEILGNAVSGLLEAAPDP